MTKSRIPERAIEPCHDDTRHSVECTGGNARLIEEIAHQLKLGRNTLYRLLREKRYLMRCNTPCQRFLDDGHFIVVTRDYTTRRGQKRIDGQPFVTAKRLIAIQKAAAYCAGRGKPVPSLCLEFGEAA